MRTYYSVARQSTNRGKSGAALFDRTMPENTTIVPPSTEVADIMSYRSEDSNARYDTPQPSTCQRMASSSTQIEALDVAVLAEMQLDARASRCHLNGGEKGRVSSEDEKRVCSH